MSQRFSYVKYDEASVKNQEAFKSQFELLEILADTLPAGRAKSCLLTHLEEAYMWTGKAIRDAQIARGVQTEHVAERSTE